MPGYPDHIDPVHRRHAERTEAAADIASTPRSMSGRDPTVEQRARACTRLTNARR
jgi:hypothetical protein